MYRQFNIQQLYVLPTHCIYVFCVDLRTKSHYCRINNEIIFCQLCLRRKNKNPSFGKENLQSATQYLKLYLGQFFTKFGVVFMYKNFCPESYHLLFLKMVALDIAVYLGVQFKIFLLAVVFLSIGVLISP